MNRYARMEGMVSVKRDDGVLDTRGHRLTTAKRGGARPGAGRPASIPRNTHVWSVRVTDDEQAALIDTLQKIRKVKV